MASFRDRFLTPQVARAITSPSAIVLAGAGAAVGIVAGLPAIGAVALGAAAAAARVLAAVPRGPRRPAISPRQLDQPWRALVEDVLDASRRFDRALEGVREGPLRERLGELRARLDIAIEEAWRIASAGNSLSNGRAQIDTVRILEELHRAESGPHTTRSEPTIAAIRSQLAAAERLDRTIADTYDRLRLLDARIDEAVTRTVELSVTQADAAIGGLSGPGGVRAELDSIVDDMEALRQAVEETRRADAGTGPPGEAGSAST